MRKKKRLGEFREMICYVGLHFTNSLETQVGEGFIDRFIEEAIEENKLAFGGGGQAYKYEGSVTAMAYRGSVSEAQRSAVEQWLIKEPEVVEYYITPLFDAWYVDLDSVKENWVKKS
ncbi:50S ribosome-binding protein YggL [Maridesulfovibrio sp. FT414]|uniref:50S ribosome-binding protein YggL n=1 Tax=Maridesulfovibrio sp. FT414 TaxID=2979469 RepID=UPI003D805F02